MNMANDIALKTTKQKGSSLMPRAVEVRFPIVEINWLAEPERNSMGSGMDTFIPTSPIADAD